MIDAPRILLLATTVQDAEMFHDLLVVEYPDVRIESDAKEFAGAFASYRPHVLILGMRSVADCERQYLSVSRDPPLRVPPPYKILLLCGKDDANRAYELCRSNHFDDYILFWPMAHDATRLNMSVHQALRSLDTSGSAALLPDIRLQARRVCDLQDTLDGEQAVIGVHAQRAKTAIEAVRTSIRTSLDAFGQRMIGSGLDDALVVKDIARLLDELEAFDRAFIEPPIDKALAAAAPIAQWIDALPAKLEPHIAAAQSLGEEAGNACPLVLVIDDDEFMRKLLQRLLQTNGYVGESVPSAATAVDFLRTRQPDLILMDVRLPDLDGIQLTRQLKAMDAYARIPIIMLTGKGNKQVLIDSRQAGAADFIVKPFDREKLLAKVATQLSMRTAIPQEG